MESVAVCFKSMDFFFSLLWWIPWMLFACCIAPRTIGDCIYWNLNYDELQSALNLLCKLAECTFNVHSANLHNISKHFEARQRPANLSEHAIFSTNQKRGLGLSTNVKRGKTPRLHFLWVSNGVMALLLLLLLLMMFQFYDNRIFQRSGK